MSDEPIAESSPHTARRNRLFNVAIAVLVLAIVGSLFLPQRTVRLVGTDSTAAALLTDAATQVEAYLAGGGQPEGMLPTLLAAPVDAIVWTTDPARSTGRQVNLNLAEANGFYDGYILSTKSTTGAVLSYAKNAAGDVFRCAGSAALGAPAPCADPAGDAW